MNIAYFYMTQKGGALAEALSATLPGYIYNKENYKDGIKEWWDRADALVFIMASGIVVRCIAPYIQSKTSDPAVIVIDQNGRFVISLLSGHLGGANALAVKIAGICGGTPVITTATDVAGVPAMDVFAKENGLVIENIENLKYISSAMVEKKPVVIISERAIDGNFPENVTVIQMSAPAEEKSCGTDICAEAAGCVSNTCAEEKHCAAAVVIAADCRAYSRRFSAKIPVLRIRLRPYVIGVGCKKGISEGTLFEAFDDFIRLHRIDAANVQALATIDLKKDEPCILALAKKIGAKTRIYTKAAVNTVDFENAGGRRIETSDFVRAVTGVGSVSEVCAYLGSDRGKILAGKTKYSGITLALAEDEGALKL